MSNNVKRGSRCLPVDSWPVADRAAWLMALEPGSPFKKGSGSAAKLAPISQVMIASGYGLYLAWLQETGNLDPEAPPSSRTPEHILLGYHQYLQSSYSPYTVATRLQQLGNAMRSIAPDANHADILRASYRIRSEAKPSRNKRERVVPPDRTEALGNSLLEEATNGKFLTNVMRAKLFRDGLIILFLTSRANRRKNLWSLDIGGKLARRGEELWLCFEGSDMKNRRSFDEPLPAELVPHICQYIVEHRPILLACSKHHRPPSNALWISSHGKHMCAAAISRQVRDRTMKAFGVAMTPHFFRDALATAQADEAPVHMMDATTLLGHGSLAVVQKHYNQSNGIRARVRHGELIDQLRGGLPAEICE
jgi:integrase/recombinase XerD